MNVSVKIVTLLKAIIEKTIHIITYPLKIVFGILRKILFHPIGNLHGADEGQQHSGNHGGQVPNGLGLLHHLAVQPLEEDAPRHGHGSHGQGPEAEVEAGERQGTRTGRM